VNVAARIVGFARPGTTVISKSVAESLPDSIPLSSIRAPSLKGVGRVKLFKVNDPAPEGTRS
jgi:class 3 adenylate cyclase